MERDGKNDVEKDRDSNTGDEEDVGKEGERRKKAGINNFSEMPSNG